MYKHMNIYNVYIMYKYMNIYIYITGSINLYEGTRVG